MSVSEKINDITKTSSKCWNKPKINEEQCKTLSPDFTNDLDASINYCGDKCTKDLRHTNIPEMPDAGCKQVVLGVFEDLAPYLMYNRKYPETSPFILLSSNKWTEELNKQFVACAVQKYLNNKCTYPIRILLPKDNSRLKKADNDPRITLLELCIIAKELQNYTMDVRVMDDELYDIVLLQQKADQTGGTTFQWKQIVTRKDIRKIRAHIQRGLRHSQGISSNGTAD